MNISAPFVKRPVATTLLAIALMLSGLAAYTLLPVAPLPRVEFPTVSVSAGLPGGSPETMASAVATPLERRFGRIAGVSEMTSTSTIGNANITLQFDLERNVDAAARDVQAAINAALGELPTGLPTRPSYRKVNPSDAPILILSLTSDALPLASVYEQANTVLAQRIAQIEGVGQVTVGGGQQPAVRVRADPAALAGVGLSMDDVRAVLASATVDQPKGGVSGTRVFQPVTANDQLFGAAAFAPLVVAQRNGRVVRLSDVASVIDDVENDRVAAWANGQRAIVVVVRRQPGANVIATIQRVKDLLPTLSRSISPSIHIEVAVDRASTIRASVREVENTLVLSVLLVVLVVFLFLRSPRATLVPSAAVPLSLVGTFGVMYLLGYSLDNLSLMALTISTGFVVDDAIVVTENVSRFLEAGESALNAALRGARQIGFTIVSITASLLAVFIPILLMGGIVGRLFREFAVTLSVAIALSAVISLTVTPAMCARLLRPVREEDHGRVYRATERAFEWVLGLYARALDRVLDHRALTLLVTGATVALTAWLAMTAPKGLFPQQDTGQLMGTSEAPQDISFRGMRERQEALLAALQGDPDVRHVVSFLGTGFSGGGNTGTLFVELAPEGVRHSTADQVIARLRARTARVPGIRLFLQSVQDVRVGGRSARTQYQYTLEDADLAELREWSPRVMEAMRQVPGVLDIATDQQNAGLSLGVDIDRDTASRLGVTPQNIDDALNDAFGQRQVAVTYSTLNQYRVILEADRRITTGPEAIERIYARTRSGGLVPITAFVHAHPTATATAVSHQGQFPAVTLSFNLAPGVSLSQAIAGINAAERRIGVPPGVQAEFRGTAQAFQESLSSEPALVLAALVAVYIVLGMLYESLVHPLTILSTLPSAGAGAFLALRVTHTEFSIIALIGIVLLIGIVKKNAIMMIDFALEAERDEGLSSRESIRKAALLRFRPITMTTMAALLGALPLAFGTGAGAELRRPLGITIVGGLLVSQLVTLLTTPAIYLALDPLRLRSTRSAHKEVEA